MPGTDEEPYGYIADWTRKRSTASLRRSEKVAREAECECDSYHGFTCGIHQRRDELRWAIGLRELRAAAKARGKPLKRGVRK